MTRGKTANQKKGNGWNRTIGWPFVCFVMVGGIGLLAGVLFSGYQDLFAVREIQVKTTAISGTENVLKEGEGVVVSFNVPVRMETIRAEAFPFAHVRVQWEDVWPGGYAGRATIVPDHVPAPGNGVVIALSGIQSVFGTKLPERRYAFPTEALPGVQSVHCGNGVETCQPEDPLTVIWSGSREGFSSKYALSSGRTLSAETRPNGIQGTEDRLQAFGDVLEGSKGKKEVLKVQMFESDGFVIAAKPVSTEEFELYDLPTTAPEKVTRP